MRFKMKFSFILIVKMDPDPCLQFMMCVLVFIKLIVTFITCVQSISHRCHSFTD